MKTINLFIEEDQKKQLQDRKEKTGIPISFQIREAIDLYFKSIKGE